MMLKIAPIVLFAFNRPDHLERTLDALSSNYGASESQLTIFCDGPRTEEEREKTDAVRKVAHEAAGFASATVVEREKNMGCADSVIDGLNYMFARHDSLIVMEDDILSSPYTLQFLNEGLRLYKHNEKVFSIAAWVPPVIAPSVSPNYEYGVCAIPRASCWGWASWRDRFENLDWEVSDYEEFKNSPAMRKAFSVGGDDVVPMLEDQIKSKINSWAIRADYARFKKDQVTIHPTVSYTTNIGMESGTHCTTFTDKYDNDISKALPLENICWVKNVLVDTAILKHFHNFYSPKQPFSLKNAVCNVLKAIKLFEITRKLYRLAQGKDKLCN